MNELPAWLLTYLIHSSVLIVGVAVFVRVVGVRSLAVRETLWTVALFGAPVTATLQHVEVSAPLFGGFELPGSESVATVAPSGIRSAPRELSHGAAPTIAREASDLRIAEAPLPVGRVVVTATVVGSLILVLLLLRSLRGLRDRRGLAAGPLVERLARLRAAHGPRRNVRISVSDRLTSPVAFGLGRPEICVPRRALDALTATQQDAMLAHELAHIVRNDPLRLLLARLVQAIFFFQPLNRLARRRLFEVIERRCDAWALKRTGEGLALAECLAEVATWMHEQRTPFSAAAMAVEGSPLTERIEGLLEPKVMLEQDRRSRTVAPLAALLLPALMLLAPNVSTAEVGAATGGDQIDLIDGADGPTADDHPLAVAVGLLDAEVESLVAEVDGLRRALSRSGEMDESLMKSLENLERRIDRMTTRRDQLVAWKNKVLRGRGLARTQDFESMSPWSDGR